MRPAQRRRAVEHLVDTGVSSQRRACRLVGLSRSVARYEPVERDDLELRSQLKALAQSYPRYGYPTLHQLLRDDGYVVNHKRTYRIYREEGLQVRTKRRKRLVRPRVPMPVPEAANIRWSTDFVSDQLANGRRIRVLNIVDDFTRECVLQVVDASISGQRLASELDRLAQRRPLPQTLVSDNGPEYTSQGHVPMVTAHRGVPALHPARETHPERFRRELQRQVSRVLPEPELVHQPGRCPVRC